MKKITVPKSDDRGFTEGKFAVKKSDGAIYLVKEINADGSMTLMYKSRGKWCRYGTIEKTRNDFLPLDDPAYLENSYKAVTEHPEDVVPEKEDDKDSSGNALTVALPLSAVQTMQDALNDKKRIVEYAQIYLERKKREINEIVSRLASQISKLQKIIDAIELYLGTNEQVVELAVGLPVPGPIYLRQSILYMDEEFGDPRPHPHTGQLGLDFQTVEDFDKWLLKNIDAILPEQKGIVAMKPSRQNRSYSDNAWINANIKENNSMTYLIIRNGENIYRLWTNIVFGKRLFPTAAEMEELFRKIDEGYGWDKDKAVNAEYVYKRNALIIQGLVDRTDFFQPLKAGANLFKPETYPDTFVLIRDDENILDDGKPSWSDWKKEINSKIGVGSRVVFINPNEIDHSYQQPKDFSDRYLTYSSGGNYPPLPETSVYQIEDTAVRKSFYRDDRQMYYFRYNPGDEVWFGSDWQYDPHPRKNRVAFGVTQNDAYILNYDQIDLEDVEYYLKTRKDKSEFIKYTMFLWTIRDSLLAEKERERHFVNLVASRMNVSEDAVWKAVDWWKFKNKWKRPITRDDAKALRMIEKHLNSETSKGLSK